MVRNLMVAFQGDNAFSQVQRYRDGPQVRGNRRQREGPDGQDIHHAKEKHDMARIPQDVMNRVKKAINK